MSDIQDEAYSEAMAEIERLKAKEQDGRREREAEIDILNRCIAKFDEWRREEQDDLKKIITELADALSHYALLNNSEKELIARAREAIK
jgi:hypothetical protein